MELAMKRLGAALVLTALLAFAAAGCGGSEPSATEDWAGGVCSAVSDWQDQIEKSAADIREQLQSPGVDTLEAIKNEITEAADASIDLSENLKSLEPPDTEAGDQAQQELEALGDQVDQTVDKTRETIEGLPENASLTEVAEAVAPLLPSIQALATNVSVTIGSVKERSSELKEGFDKADSCEKFR
jgi:septation ring formation regulator EzrA